MAYVEVELPKGDKSIGSAFHIGDGVFVTARHVVAGNTIIQIRITESLPLSTKEYFQKMFGANVSDEYIKEYEESGGPILTNPPSFTHWEKPLELAIEPIFHEDERVDLAIFKVKELHEKVQTVILGIHMNDLAFRGLWHLSEAIVLGYPPIPMATEPHLVAAKAEIHTYITTYHSPHVHFILSSMPRGGFSGGVAIHESGSALGVITSSFGVNNQPEQLGFFAVLSVAPIIDCLKKTDLVPRVQKLVRKHYLE